MLKVKNGAVCLAEGMNILIFGSQGFIGKNIVDYFQAGNNLILFNRRTIYADSHRGNELNIKHVTGSLKNLDLIKQVIRDHKVDVVIHLVSSLIPSSNESDFSNELNEVVEPTYNLLNYLSEANVKIVFFSSGGTIYGKSTDTLISECHVEEPINYYGYSKLLIENYICFLHRTQKLPFLILRPSNVYGRYQRIDKLQGFIAVALGKLISNNVINIFGSGETIRDYIDVEDLASITRKLVDTKVNNEVINIGTGIGVSLNEIMLTLEKVANTKLRVNYVDKREVDVDRMVLDISKLNKIVDFKPKGLSDGIRDFFKYLKEKNE